MTRSAAINMLKHGGTGMALGGAVPLIRGYPEP